MTPKIIVLDDDPTGSQTVHSCLLLLKWDVETLVLGLQDNSPIVFILTNTRALSPAQAKAITTEVCHNLKTAILQAGIEEFLVVSRSDSTLRGHYPIETDAIAAELGPFDAHFMVPAFFEGGRITRNSVHYVVQDETPIPAHETEFAKDSVFGYSTSYLPDYVAEKTGDRISAEQVKRFTLERIRQGCLDELLALENNVCVAVDGESQLDLNQFAQDVLTGAAQGKRFLFRSAASLLTALAALPPQPIAAEDMAQYVKDHHPGAVLVGSHVKKTTQQLAALLKAPDVVGVEVDVTQMVDNLDEGKSRLLEGTLTQVRQIHEQGKTPAIYTSREELTFPDVQTRLAFGEHVSALLMDIVRGLPNDLGYLISKGGITSNDTLSKGLALRTTRLLGQILPGCSVVRTAANHPQFSAMPVVLFPGNVGDENALALAYQRLSR
ncbi:four-carbon acid sugar kinase family protein [Oscillatoria sp. CS-180]|uniref:four-carbon acid sugar kinase family protein n=1 Tax=Oscillatoria sp. CS-180 TaxID=3021720 RepID=UPI0023303F5C|nr:four-carbon acid sugar kinase family protein [Oscillatoria sp. CS-180]MDB9528143.1 four-carbon acid sugar kinase family protein [Oscillatoria sp. CS-180]